MRKKRIYIAGKVTGESHIECAVNFSRAVNYLRGYGFLPINPLEVVNDWNCPWEKAMRLTIAEMMKADAVLMLDNWTNSTGASIELELATNLKIPVFENYDKLARHFGQYPRHRCSHPNTRIVAITTAAGCETTVQRCTWCGTNLTDPITEC